MLHALNLHDSRCCICVAWFVSQQETDDLDLDSRDSGSGTPGEENSGGGGGSSDRGEHAPEGQRVEGGGG